MDLDQAANGATIAAVGKRVGMPNHAVTVALAAALQESKLRNLSYGDRDSVGLFQQRPSQGWGSQAEILDPVYAANAFYMHLRRVRGWETMPIEEAAQRVQRSAGGYAYAQWEPQARVMAQALTGEVVAGLTCAYNTPEPVEGTLSSAATRELGSGVLTSALPSPRGWTVASWAVANAYRYRVSHVSYGGKTWTKNTGEWRTDATATTTVRIRQEAV
ncbi:MAG: hypothetical protein QOG53_3378 [Frankiales bacterium]|nr:hypothetical protein [Frankiales bacterium]